MILGLTPTGQESETMDILNYQGVSQLKQSFFPPVRKDLPIIQRSSLNGIGLEQGTV